MYCLTECNFLTGDITNTKNCNKNHTSVITMNNVPVKIKNKSLRFQNCIAVLVTVGAKLRECLKIRNY